jgi:hypothetical protein
VSPQVKERPVVQRNSAEQLKERVSAFLPSLPFGLSRHIPSRHVVLFVFTGCARQRRHCWYLGLRRGWNTNRRANCWKLHRPVETANSFLASPRFYE